MTTTQASPPDAPPAALSTLDRYLPVWIGAAMVAGILLGRLAPGLGGALGAVEIEGVSLPIALGLLVMMYPVLAKVRYDRIGEVTRDTPLLVSSLLLNWVLGPARTARPPRCWWRSTRSSRSSRSARSAGST